jgi:hypothetical protein
MIDASPAALLAVWERAAPLPAAERARALLALESSGDGSANARFDGRADANRWTLGRRDTALARVFRALYGDRVEAIVRCAACDEMLDFELSLNALYLDSDAEVREPGTFCLRVEDYELTLRPLESGDLSSLPRSPARALECILRRCVLSVRRAGVDVDVALLPEPVRDAVSEALRQADPVSEVRLVLDCAGCGATDGVLFDIGAFLWEYLERSALQTMREVHELGSAYGWAERDILALSNHRRRVYLDLFAS